MNTGVGLTRARVLAILAVLVTIAISIMLRKMVEDQTIKVAIGGVEIIVIAVVMFRAFRRS